MHSEGAYAHARRPQWWPMNTSFDTKCVDGATEGVLFVTPNCPDVCNEMNTQMGCDLHDLVCPPVIGSRDLRCIVLTGAGDKTICAGGELEKRNTKSNMPWRRQHANFTDAVYAGMECPVPVIAAPVVTC